MKKKGSKFNRIAIKVGSNVISRNDGSLNVGRMLRLVEDIAVLCKQGNEVILISSGAVAAGRGEVVPSKKTNEIAAKQIWAAVGQVKLMSNYQFLFGKYGIQAGQLLAAKESFRDRRHYLNMKNCITAMLENNVLPVVNENDTVSVNELMFTDNDELSGLIASMMDCGSLMILTNVDGIFNAVPGCPGAEIIKEIGPGTGDLSQYILSSKSGFGRGGMLTKYSNACRIASEGIHVYIANGNRDSIISDIVREKEVPYTHFMANTSKKNGVKKWLSHSDTFARGAVYINSGAREALTGDKATSLLMIGVVKVEGYFKEGDIVRILDEDGNSIGLGKSQYDSKKAEQNIGEKRSKPFVHYDFMVISEKTRDGVHI
ncbi:MAG TPA: glutamate 5-kinase [Bacteroidales bacterium]|nr:glutamate 5-kinase [Bacteroidales bacterium]